MKNTVRLNFEFPTEPYSYLKMLCFKKGISSKEFASILLIREIEEYEDRLLAKKAQECLFEIDEDKNIDFEEASSFAG
ncbi:hypothetical protein [Parachlamydia sp. AcF125]|uniref:hypothetical protein n=1 Tax=Parachlamydia sp. AcF125 TaxID=2795736 RepID=UPI001BC8EF0A|nr:hypothetical protein [Parachlamydia sp. AcF125]MBS4167682.1 hypothetical protein [Parachlamydia sp. AcF125]